jgi:hypothetical protein
MAMLALTAGLLGSAGNAKADPRSGAAVFGGIAVHQGYVKTAGGRASGFLSSGLDAGAEVQQVLGREWSVAGFAQTSAESVAGDAARTYSLASHGILGGEARYWEGAKYVGVHLGAYSEALAAKSGSGAKDTQAVGWGLGLSWGWEGDSGWFAAGQLDLAEVAYTNAVHTLTGIRAHVGYRWKRE